MSESDFKASDSESDKEVENNESSCDKVSTFRQNRSRVWDFFEKLEHRSGYAECKMCQLQMSYKSSVSNLSKHAMRKHKIIWQKAANVGIPKHIPELVHFKQNNGSNVASCKLCNESVSCTRPMLRKHLASCHPKIQLDNRNLDDQKAKIYISENGQFYEIETTQDDQDEQVLLALSFFATGSYQRMVGRNIATTVSQQSVSKAIRDVTKALNQAEITSKYIKFPSSINERNEIKRKFYEKYHIPGVVGCIDGTQVALIRPKENEERYFNRKHFHSQNVQINTDALEMDTVYFDEYVDEIKQAAGKKNKSTYTPTTRKSKVTVENNTNEEQLEAKYTSPKLSKLDIFCTYLISLLKELPDRECRRLQGEFVNAAIQAQLRSEKVAVTVPVPDGDLNAVTD